LCHSYFATRDAPLGLVLAPSVDVPGEVAVICSTFVSSLGEKLARTSSPSFTCRCGNRTRLPLGQTLAAERGRFSRRHVMVDHARRGRHE
jgi:hypothetical protein